MSERFREIVWPYALGCIAGCVHAIWFLSSFPVDSEILAASISMGSIFCGFLATSKAVVLGMQSPRIERLRSTRFFGLFLNYLEAAIWISLLYCGFNLFGYLVHRETFPAWYGPIWSGFTVLTMATFLQITRFVMQMVHLVDMDSREANGK